MKKEKLWTKNYVLILLCAIFISFTQNIFVSIFPTYILDIGGSNSITGFMMTGLTITGIITRIVFGNVIDQWGRKKTLLLACFIFALNTILFCFTTNMTLLFILRALNGFSLGLILPVFPTIIADITPNARLVEGIGFLGAASSLAAAVTPSIGLYIYQSNGAILLFITTFISTLVSTFIAILMEDHYQPVKKDTTTKDAAKNTKSFIDPSIILPSFIIFFLFIGFSSVGNFIVPYAISTNIDNIGLFFVALNITNITFRLVTGFLAKYIKIEILIYAGILATFTGILLVAFANSIIMLVGSAILLGTGMTCVHQLMQVHIYNTVKIEKRGNASATFQLFSDLGTGIGALTWGNFSTILGYVITFILSSVTTLFSAVLFYVNRRKEK